MYDVLIVGGGPAGLSAAIYASRYNLKTLVLSPLFGGQITESIEVENYPGTEKATGIELMESWKKHAELFDAETKSEAVESINEEIDSDKKYFRIKTNKDKYLAKSVIYSAGANHRHLGIKGEKEFASKGVSYCPTCDGMFFMGKTVAVIGGGDAALRGVQVMIRYSDKIYLIHRRDEFRAEPILVDRIKKESKVEILTPHTVKEIKGDDTVTSIVLDNDSEIEVNGVFIEVGNIPATKLVENLNIDLDDTGYIKVNKDQSTNVEGFFAAGDVTTGSNKFRQVLTAASEGAIAADSVFKYVGK